jgi:uncharacterized protein YabN with tetrapyrrole methylase and pyrophosphatase domain
VEECAKQSGQAMNELPLETLEQFWAEAKQQENSI